MLIYTAMRKINLWSLILISLISICCYIQHLCSSPVNKNFLSFYYRHIVCDTFKHNAAMFLFDNMQYHYSYKEIPEPNKQWESWRMETDDIIKEVLTTFQYNNIPQDTIRKIQAHREHTFTDTLATLPDKLFKDNTHITNLFLIQHIENAFNVWKSSKYATKLSFEEFKEFILPYRSLRYYGFTNNGSSLNDLFADIIQLDETSNIIECIKKYNCIIWNMRNINGRKSKKVHRGIYDMYIHGIHDCTDVSTYGCDILRACGIPVVVENVIGYRHFAGKHFHCSVYDTDSCKWYPFNAESSIPGNFSFETPKCLNVYRNLFSAQKDTPYFLKANNETVPPELSSPCIKDVTSLYRDTYCITLPFNENTNNKVAYLVTFTPQKGILPVTWGSIDNITQTVTFKNIIPQILYIPVYYTEKGYHSFGEPFYVEIQGYNATLQKLLPEDKRSEKSDIILTRKFPQKEKMKQVAKNLIGGQFLGSNNYDFKDAKILYTITKAPEPIFKEYKFKNKEAYKYYRFSAPQATPNANIAWLEWVSENKYGYKNSDTLSRLHILSPNDTILIKHDFNKVKLLDIDRGRMNWAKEYDNDVTTAPGAYRDITITLDEAQIVTAVRFAPLNADNGIKSNNNYILYYWDNGWKLAGQQKAKFEFLEFKNVPTNKLYWLRNITEGKEELPFIMENGKQKFIYADILVEEDKKP